jgi:hypothetical protein
MAGGGWLPLVACDGILVVQTQGCQGEEGLVGMWEYQIVTVNRTRRRWELAIPDGGTLEGKDQVADYLNYLGGSGWELVSTAPYSHWEGTTEEYDLFFKRRTG